MKARLLGWLTVVLCFAAVTAGHALTGETDGFVDRRAPLQSMARLDEATSVRVNSYRVGSVWYLNDRVICRTPAVYLLVNVTIRSVHSPKGQLAFGGVALNGHTFEPIRDQTTMSPAPGFDRTGDLLFELPAEAVAGFRVTASSRAIFYALDNRAVIDLGIDEARAATLLRDHRHDVLKSESATEEVSR